MPKSGSERSLRHPGSGQWAVGVGSGQWAVGSENETQRTQRVTEKWIGGKWKVGGRNQPERVSVRLMWLEKWVVRSEKWEVGSGKWEVGSGKWEVGSGK